ncbi:Poly(A)-specific ribonuclease PARN isoform 1 [Theobroma cacao]|uniref:Poly(A)-specific ribonuclease PARN isoform 1 n=1 Tax=Theobroma cacao TaxID=3641 RepID=A0A061F3T1_THECC|nr:Poly(A)-specific ribonuclease PARN isoform 1 [Theobroma cacao]EOY12010.1 Poly(A)-specific ribonuclease PARN isoform 1 [Theobroma cacao]
MNTTKHWPKRALILSRVLSRAFFSNTSTSASPSPTFPLKHVTRSNFDSALVELRSHVRAADFVAIDLEMTGVTSAPWRESFEFDRFDIRYLKVKDSAEKFAVVQFGVCPFRWDSLKQSFIAHPHNFFVFPRQEIPLDGPSNEFLCQTTSMDFLAKYQFDFNACIHEGVSYLSRGQEDEARRRLKSLYKEQLTNSSHNLRETMDVPLVRVADVLFTERMKKRLSEWRDELLQNRSRGPQDQGASNDLNQQFQTVFFKMRPALSLNGFTSHQLSLIRMVTRKHFKDLVYVRFNGESSSQELVVFTDSESDKDRLVEEVKNEHYRRAEMRIHAAVGFRHVIDLLSSENKLIVGHNCILDIAHIHSKFLGPLPLTAEEFVSCVNKYFPNIIDTKILLNADNILQQRMKKSSTSLSSAFSLLCPELAHGFKSKVQSSQPCVKVEVHVDEMRSPDWNSGAKHEAGYDAFMTGCVFAQVCSHLGIDFQLYSTSENLVQNEKLQKHMNLLYLSWINGDVIDLRTGSRTAEFLGSNILRKRFPRILYENIVLIWGFPSKLKPSVIRECICKTLGPTSVISIYRMDQTAVFVQFSKAELVSDFLILKESLERSDDAISVLHPLSQLLEGGNTRAASYETYKDICESPVSELLFADQAEAVGIKWKTKLLPSDVVESQEDNHFHLENALDHTPETVEKSKIRKTEDVVNDSSNKQLTCNEIIDTLLKVEKIRRTSNL